VDPEPITSNAKKLMIVDDDADMRTLLAEYFRRLGFEVTEKESGPAALQAATGNRFDCFIFDVAMPDMSGLELVGEGKRGSAVAQQKAAAHGDLPQTPRRCQGE